MFKDYLSFKDDTSIDIPYDLFIRLAGFTNYGIPKAQLWDVIARAARIGKPGSEEWSQVILTVGDNLAKQARDCEEDWLNISFWYFLARFPHYFNLVMKDAYVKHKEAYLKAGVYSQYPVEKIIIDFEGNQVSTYLRKPTINDSPVPMVMIWGGIDIWKSDLQIHQLGNNLLEQGIAVLAIDSPGTGECPIPISTSAENWFMTVLNAVKKRDDLNSNKIGCYGLSFGGYWATKLAIQLPWLAGAVNVGGPVHHTFKQDWIGQLPDSIYNTLAFSCGFKPGQDNEFLSYCDSLSLEKQNYLPATSNAPLLLINGAQDNLVTISEIDFLKKRITECDSLIFSHDRHVASKNWLLHTQFSVNWLARKLQ